MGGRVRQAPRGPSPNGKRHTPDTTMTLWHASTELRLTTATAVVAKTVYLAASYMSRVETGLGLDLGAKLGLESAKSAELDTSG